MFSTGISTVDTKLNSNVLLSVDKKIEDKKVYIINKKSNEFTLPKRKVLCPST